MTTDEDSVRFLVTVIYDETSLQLECSKVNKVLF